MRTGSTNTKETSPRLAGIKSGAHSTPYSARTIGVKPLRKHGSEVALAVIMSPPGGGGVVSKTSGLREFLENFSGLRARRRRNFFRI